MSPLTPSSVLQIFQIVGFQHFIREEFRDMPASFGNPLPLDGLRGLITAGVPKNGCSALDPPPKTEDNFTGKWIVLLARYDCDFGMKVRNAQDAGYDAAIVHNVNSSDLETMSAKDAVGILIPSVFISDNAGDIIEEQYLYSYNYYVVMNGDLPFNINTHLLLPFAIVVGLCLIVMIIFMLVKCIKDRRRARRHRLPHRSLKKIPTCKFTKGDPYDMCAICLDEYAEGDKLRVLPCAHAYHCKCIDPWLTKSRRVCPVCKRRVLAAGERRRRCSDSDSGSDDSREPLVASTGTNTQGGTFVPQRENPFVRASRFLSRMRREPAAPITEQDVPVEAPEDTGNERYVTPEEPSRSYPGPGSAQVAPYLSGVLDMRTNHFVREENEDTEPLLPSSSTSAPTVRMVDEFRPPGQSKKKARKTKSRSKSRQRSTSETVARPSTHATEAQGTVVSADHSINRDDPSSPGQIGVAALPNTQFSSGDARRYDFPI